jgi:hypothetical protein
MTLSYTMIEREDRAFADHRGYRIEASAVYEIGLDRYKAHLHLTNPDGHRTHIRSWEGDYHLATLAIEAAMHMGEHCVDGLMSQKR